MFIFLIIIFIKLRQEKAQGYFLLGKHPQIKKGQLKYNLENSYGTILEYRTASQEECK